MTAYPHTEEDFIALREAGKTVVYRQTESDVSPGEDWDYWAKRVTQEGTVHVWRRIVALEDAEQYQEDPGET